MSEEFTSVKKPKNDEMVKLPEAALLLCAVLDSSETEEDDAWFSGPVGEHDHQ